MSFAFKYAKNTEKEARFAELAEGIRELIEADMNWKEKPRELLKKVAEKIKTVDSGSLATFGETEMRFGIFLKEAVKEVAKAPVEKNPASVKILNRGVDNVIDREKEVLTDLGTLAQLMLLADRQSTGGLSKLIEKPDSQLRDDIKISRESAEIDLEKAVGSGFRRKAL
jgi:hypothetical protein